jgi:hypothetical protein
MPQCPDQSVPFAAVGDSNTVGAGACDYSGYRGREYSVQRLLAVLLSAPRQFEILCNEHRPYQGNAQA